MILFSFALDKNCLTGKHHVIYENKCFKFILNRNFLNIENNLRYCEKLNMTIVDLNTNHLSFFRKFFTSQQKIFFYEFSKTKGLTEPNAIISSKKEKHFLSPNIIFFFVRIISEKLQKL